MDEDDEDEEMVEDGDDGTSAHQGSRRATRAERPNAEDEFIDYDSDAEDDQPAIADIDPYAGMSPPISSVAGNDSHSSIFQQRHILLQGSP